MISRFRSRRRVRAVRHRLLQTPLAPLVLRCWPPGTPPIAAADAAVDRALTGPSPAYDWAPSPDPPARRSAYDIVSRVLDR